MTSPHPSSERREIKWIFDSDGDWQLYLGGQYIGMICPHKEYLQVLADCRSLVGAGTNDLEDNKRWLEKWGVIGMKTDQFREQLLEKEGLI